MTMIMMMSVAAAPVPTRRSSHHHYDHDDGDGGRVTTTPRSLTLKTSSWTGDTRVRPCASASASAFSIDATVRWLAGRRSRYSTSGADTCTSKPTSLPSS